MEMRKQYLSAMYAVRKTKVPYHGFKHYCVIAEFMLFAQTHPQMPSQPDRSRQPSRQPSVPSAQQYRPSLRMMSRGMP